MSKLSAFVRQHFTLRGKKKFIATTAAIAASVAATRYPEYSALITQIRDLTLGYLVAESTVDVVRSIKGQ